MKQYFAKYLPVEGEISVGDTVLSTDGMMDKITTMDNIQETDKLVKLFLCTKAINNLKVGDKVRQFSKPEKEFTLAKIGEAIKNDLFFKAISEISAEALSYVKEHDEFDVDDLEMVFKEQHVCLCEDRTLNVYRTPMQQICDEMVDDHRGGDFCMRMENVLQFIKIKGPCGHYH